MTSVYRDGACNCRNTSCSTHTGWVRNYSLVWKYSVGGEKNGSHVAYRPGPLVACRTRKLIGVTAPETSVWPGDVRGYDGVWSAVSLHSYPVIAVCFVWCLNSGLISWPDDKILSSIKNQVKREDSSTLKYGVVYLSLLCEI